MSSIRWRSVAAVSTTLVASLLWATEGQAGGASCKEDLARVTAGASGPLACVSTGIPTVIVDRSTPLALKTLKITLSGERTAKTYRVVVRGQPPFTAKAKGVFLLFTVVATNETGATHAFKPAAPWNQVALDIDNTPYFASFDDPNLDLGSFAAGAALHPHQSVRGVMWFDVPKAVLRTYPAKTAVVVVNFGQNTTSGVVTQIGLIDLAGAA